MAAVGSLSLGVAGGAGATTPAAESAVHINCARATKALTRIERVEARISAGLPGLTRAEHRAAADGRVRSGPSHRQAHCPPRELVSPHSSDQAFCRHRGGMPCVRSGYRFGGMRRDISFRQGRKSVTSVATASAGEGRARRLMREVRSLSSVLLCR